MNKIIKIQSFVRGAEMRDRIKLKTKNVNHRNKPTENQDKSELNYEKTTTQKFDEYEMKNFDEIIVNYIILYN